MSSHILTTLSLLALLTLPMTAYGSEPQVSQPCFDQVQKEKPDRVQALQEQVDRYWTYNIDLMSVLNGAYRSDQHVSDFPTFEVPVQRQKPTLVGVVSPHIRNRAAHCSVRSNAGEQSTWPTLVFGGSAVQAFDIALLWFVHERDVAASGSNDRAHHQAKFLAMHFLMDRNAMFDRDENGERARSRNAAISTSAGEAANSQEAVHAAGTRLLTSSTGKKILASDRIRPWIEDLWFASSSHFEGMEEDPNLVFSVGPMTAFFYRRHRSDPNLVVAYRYWIVRAAHAHDPDLAAPWIAKVALELEQSQLNHKASYMKELDTLQFPEVSTMKE